MTPLKRHPALIPLSKDHHFGLLLCWKIRQGFANEISVERIADYVCWFFKNHLVEHFALEEKLVFPLLDEGHPLRVEALNQHQQLRDLHQEISQNKGTKDASLKNFEKILEKHIRMEERNLFPEIQESVGEEKLMEMESIVEMAHKNSPDDWNDPFWLKKSAKNGS